MLITTSSETMQKEIALCITTFLVCYPKYIDELRAVSEATKPDAFALLKTGLTMPNDKFFLSNYRLCRLDRNRCGGDITIYVCTVLSCSVPL